MKNTLFINIVLGILIAIVVVALAIGFTFNEKINFFPKPPVDNVQVTPPATSTPVAIQKNISGFKKFSSEKDFKDYLAKAEEQSGFYDGVSMKRTLSAPMPAFSDSIGEMGAVSGMGAPSSAIAPQESLPQRVSETNIQVAGIDEPDIVKTNGKEIYLSSEFYNILPMRGDIMMEGIMAPDYYQRGETKIIKAFPPADLAKLSAIKKSGNLH